MERLDGDQVKLLRIEDAARQYLEETLRTGVDLADGMFVTKRMYPNLTADFYDWLEGQNDSRS